MFSSDYWRRTFEETAGYVFFEGEMHRLHVANARYHYGLPKGEEFMYRLTYVKPYLGMDEFWTVVASGVGEYLTLEDGVQPGREMREKRLLSIAMEEGHSRRAEAFEQLRGLGYVMTAELPRAVVPTAPPMPHPPMKDARIEEVPIEILESELRDFLGRENDGAEDL